MKRNKHKIKAMKRNKKILIRIEERKAYQAWLEGKAEVERQILERKMFESSCPLDLEEIN